MMSKHVYLLLIALTCGAIEPSSALAYCVNYLQPTTLGTVVDDRVNEASGLAASARYPGVLWTHNDSGDGPVLYALRLDGSLIGRWSVQGANAVDWEDIAMGPCDDGQRRCLYIGDIGNNSKDRTDLTLYKVEEPELDPTATLEELQQTKPAIALPFRYPFEADDIPDAETLLVSPAGAVYILTKENKGRLLRLPSPQTPDQQASLELIAQTNLSTLTGGDISPEGDVMVVRNYLRVYEFFWSEQDPGAALSSPDKAFSITSQPQGESMTYVATPEDVRLGLVTLSEKTQQPLIFYGCIADEGLQDDISPPDMSDELDLGEPAQEDMSKASGDMSARPGSSADAAASGGCAGCASAPRSPSWGLWGLLGLGGLISSRARRRHR